MQTLQKISGGNGACDLQEADASREHRAKKPDRLTWSHFSAIALGFAIFFLGLVLYKIFLLGELSEIDPDEGFNAMKSLLAARGVALYQEIWSDQPPFFTLLLAGWFNLFGASLVAARVLVVGLSVALACALAKAVYEERGAIGGVAVLLLLPLSSHYLFYSGALMIGLPALSFVTIAVLALVLARSRRRSRAEFVAISAGFFALAFLTKFTAITVLPAILAELVLLNASRRSSRSLNPIVVWLSVVGVVGFVIVLIFTPELLRGGYSTLISTHLEARGGWFRSVDPKRLHDFFTTDAPIKTLALVGLATGLIHARRQMVLPGLWLLCSILALRNHHPLWDHHYLILSIPTVWLAAYGLDEVARGLDAFRRRLNDSRVSVRVIQACVVIVMTLSLWSSARRDIRQVQKEPVVLDSQAVVSLSSSASPGEWVLTDRPLYAFAAKKLVPPGLVVASKKRFRTQEISFRDFRTALDHYRPEYVVWARFDELSQKLNKRMKRDYTLVYERSIKTDDQKKLEVWKRNTAPGVSSDSNID